MVRIEPRTGAKANVAAGHSPGMAVVVGRSLVVTSSTDQCVLLFDTTTLRSLGDEVVGVNRLVVR